MRIIHYCHLGAQRTERNKIARTALEKVAPSLCSLGPGCVIYNRARKLVKYASTTQGEALVRGQVFSGESNAGACATDLGRGWQIQAREDDLCNCPSGRGS